MLEQTPGLTRKELAKGIHQEWLEAGGALVSEELLLGRVKKALSMLKQQGTAENFQKQRWRLVPESGNVQVEPPALFETGSDDLLIESDEPVDEPPTERVIGSGTQAVYAFYLPSYKELATSRRESRWPMKIGLTTKSVAKRLDYIRTGLPEEPVVALEIWADDAATLEKALHSVLTLRGQRYDGAPGMEWFNTNADELAAIYRFIFSS